RLRNCTPLFPLPSVIRTWTDSSKSLYFRRLHRYVRNDGPWAGTLPTIAPSRTLQYSRSPSQPSRSLPFKNASDSWPPRTVAPPAGSAVARADTTSRSAPAPSPIAALIGIPPLGLAIDLESMSMCSGSARSRSRRVGETHRWPSPCVGGFHPPYNRPTRLREQTLTRQSTASRPSRSPDESRRRPVRPGPG